MFQTIAYWWVVFIVALGCILSTALLLLAVHLAAWKLVREVVGWPKLVQILREHRQKEDKHGS